MYYINPQPDETGNHGNPQTMYAEGMAALPEELLGDYIAAKGFVTLTVEEDTVTAVAIDQAAYDAYMAGHQERPPTADRDYEPGEYLTIDGALYRAELPILAGTPLTPGTNIIETTIEAELAREEN